MLITNELLYQLSYFGEPAFIESGANIECFFEKRNKKTRIFVPPFLFLCQRDDFETHTENAFLIVVADDFERAHFGGVFHVEADAETFVIVAYVNHAYGVGCSFGEAFHVKTAHGFFLDTLAALSGFLRPTPGISDESFREYLRAKIQCNHWNGQNETLPGILAMAFPGADAVLIDNQDGTVTASLSEDTQYPLEDLFPCPSGIRLSVREA